MRSKSKLFETKARTNYSRLKSVNKYKDYLYS